MPDRRAYRLALAALLLPAAADAAPRFAHIFGDHAVLQRNVPVKVWGWADPSHSLTVSLAGQSVTATADASGKWTATFAPAPAGGPYELSVADGVDKATLSDIMIGDVLLCGGQSNMQFPEHVSTGAWNDIGGSANANLRYILIQTDSQPAPLGDLAKPAAWKVVGPETIGEASAVCYNMAKVLQKEQNVAIGMIDSYWGGTTIQGWISAPTLRTLPKYVSGLDAVALLAHDPAKARADQAQRDEAWWDAHDAANKANRAFVAPGFNDSTWSSLTADRGWKDMDIAALKDFDGVVWLRANVTLTADQAETANELQLGPIDSYDTTWINGAWIGSSGMSWLWRDYSVPAGVFKAGENSIVIRVLGGGGLSGRPQNRFIKTSDGQAIAITATWKYKTGMRAKGLSLPPAPWAVPTSLSTLYNGMIAPLAGYRVKLAAWYQGEANTGEAAEYRMLLSMLMSDWRKSFDDPNLPFLVDQLSAYGAVATTPGKSDWAELREAQRLSVDTDPHAALAVTFDVGDRTDIHPAQKVVVGGRMARAARAIAYGEAVTPGGPEATAVTRSGNDLIVSFKDANGGLRTYSSNTAIGFEACTAPNTCVYVTAVPKGDTIVLENANKPDVVRVRYAWADSPYANLYSADDLPAVPFELDVKP